MATTKRQVNTRLDADIRYLLDVLAPLYGSKTAVVTVGIKLAGAAKGIKLGPAPVTSQTNPKGGNDNGKG